LNPLAIYQWITLGYALFEKGSAAWTRVKEAAAAEGIEGDNSELDRVAADADRRREISEREAAGG
jgi:hypothetical protein